jgi:hypothetical protein
VSTTLHTLIVDRSVLEALQAAFPKPEASAERALSKYVLRLEHLLNASLQRPQSVVQRKMQLFNLSLHDLANSGGQVGPNKVRLHAWLMKQGLGLIEVVEKGSKFSQSVSLVKLSALAKLEPTGSTTSSIAGAFQARRVPTAPHVSIGSIFRDDPIAPPLLHKDHAIKVDTESVQAYLDWLSQGASKMSAAARETAKLQAQLILKEAASNGGSYPQVPKRSFFGRTYYEGVSVQSVNRELRRAMLGDCWEYDIQSAVIAWKLGFASEILQVHGLDHLTVEGAFPCSVGYVRDKRDVVVALARAVLWEEREYGSAFCTGLMKQALTALGFGARQRTQGWRDVAGHWINPAIVDILRKPSWRDLFFTDRWVIRFIEEQDILDDYLVKSMRRVAPEWLAQPALQTESGRVSKAKVLAFLYQQSETQVMNILAKTAQSLGREPIARVHDAIFFKHKLGIDRQETVINAMREATGNPFWSLKATQLHRYVPAHAQTSSAKPKAKVWDPWAGADAIDDWEANFPWA